MAEIYTKTWKKGQKCQNGHKMTRRKNRNFGPIVKRPMSLGPSGPELSSDTSCTQILTYMGEKMRKNWKLGKMAKIGPNFGQILGKTHATRSLIKSAIMVRFSNDQCPRVRLVQGYLKKFWPNKSSNKRLRKCAKTVKKGQKTPKSGLTSWLCGFTLPPFLITFFGSKLILNRWVLEKKQQNFQTSSTKLA